MNLKGIECEDVDWINLVHDEDNLRAVVNNVMKIRIP
jgi:hypothetical protein